MAISWRYLNHFIIHFTDEELCIITIILNEETKQLNSNKQKWGHEAWQKGDDEREFSILYKELIEDESKFNQYFRISEFHFNTLLDKVYVNLKQKIHI